MKRLGDDPVTALVITRPVHYTLCFNNQAIQRHNKGITVSTGAPDSAVGQSPLSQGVIERTDPASQRPLPGTVSRHRLCSKLLP